MMRMEEGAMNTRRRPRFVEASVTTVLVMVLANAAIADTLDCPDIVAQLDTVGGYTVAAEGDLLVTGGSRQLTIVDISQPENPEVIGEIEIPIGVTDAVISGGFVFLAVAYEGLHVIDISSPSVPVEAASFDTPGYAAGLDVVGSFAYVADATGGLLVIDVSSPAEPTEVSRFSTPGNARNVTVSEGIAYVADYDAGLRLVDVSDPTEPHEIGYFDTPGYVWDVVLSGGLAFIADSGPGLRIIDVNTPTAPVEVGFSTPFLQVGTIQVRGGFAYVTDPHNRNLKVLDVSTPSNPEVVCVVDTGHQAYDVALAGELVFFLEPALLLLRANDRRYWFDTAARLPGLFGSMWRTDVVARNFGHTDSQVAFRLHSPDGVVEFDSTISPGDQGVFPDIVGLMGYEGKGCLEVLSSEPLQVSGRIFNETQDGTFGQYLAGQRVSDSLNTGDVASILQLRQKEGEFRTNISITNTGDESAVVRVRLYDENGDRLVQYGIGVGVRSLVQDPEPFKRRAGRPDLGWGFAEIEVVSGNGILATASVVDSRTNDATTIPVKH